MASEYTVNGTDFSAWDDNTELYFDHEDRNGTRYYYSNKCPKCGGTGYLREYNHVEGGICFLCEGSGYHHHTYKVMTEAYNQKLTDRRLAKMRKEAKENNKKFLEKMGFSADGRAWVVTGDTFSIKDELKEAGAKFNNWLGWHFPMEQDKYPTIMVNATDVVSEEPRWEFDAYTGEEVVVDDSPVTLVQADPNTGAYEMAPCYLVENWLKERKNQREKELREASGLVNEFFGQEGQRITITVTLQRVAWFDTHYTYYGETTYIYTFADAEGHIFVWKTASHFPDEFEEGKAVELKGTIKAHSEFRGEKQTELTRCKITA